MAKAAGKLRDRRWPRLRLVKARAELQSVAKATRGGQRRGSAAGGGQGSQTTGGQGYGWLTNGVVDQGYGWATWRQPWLLLAKRRLASGAVVQPTISQGYHWPRFQVAKLQPNKAAVGQGCGWPRLQVAKLWATKSPVGQGFGQSNYGEGSLRLAKGVVDQGFRWPRLPLAKFMGRATVGQLTEFSIGQGWG